MKKGWITVSVLLICAMLFGACGKKEAEDQDKLDDLKNKLEQESESSKQGKKPKKKNGEKKQEETEPEGFFAKAFYDGLVENNGGYFVRVGNRVYYRTFDKRCVGLTSVGPSYVDEISVENPITVMYYDLYTEETEEVCELHAAGPLYATVDGLCVMSYPDGYSKTALITEDGEVDEAYYDGAALGVSEDGRAIAVLMDEGGVTIPALYVDGTYVGTPYSEDDDFDWVSYVGISGDSMVGLVSTDDEKTLFSYGADGTLTMLGTLPAFDMDTYTLSPNLEDFAATEDGGYLTLSYRDGTADAVVAWSVVEVTCGVEDSAKEIESEEISETYGYSYPKVCVDENGKAVLGAHKAGELYLSDKNHGDLMCHPSEGEDFVVYENYVYDGGEEPLYLIAIEDGYYFSDDAAFVMKISADRSPEEDFNIFRAYDLSAIMYECIRIDEEHLSEYGPITDNFYTLSSVGFANGDIDYERLIGTWECSSAIVEGCEYQDHSEDLYATRVTFNEDGTGVLSSIERATGKSSMPDRKLIQTEQEEPEESPDYCYYFETDEDDPTQVGVCYLTHGRLGIHFLYHYDGNSTGWYLGSFHKVAE